MGREGYESDPGWFVDTRLGRLALSALLLGLTYFLVVWNLPDSAVKDQLRPPIETPVRVAGIAQDWGVFAPNPVSSSKRVEADVEFANGAVERYQFPDGDAWIGAYSEFRWRKFESRVRDDKRKSRWRPTAIWISEQYGDRRVVKVDLIRLTRPVPEPGTDEVTEWDEEIYFTYRLADSPDSPEEASE